MILAIQQDTQSLLSTSTGSSQGGMEPLPLVTLYRNLPAEGSQYSPRWPTRPHKIKNLYADI